MIGRIFRLIIWYFSWSRVKIIISEKSEGFGDSFHKAAQIFVPFIKYCDNCKEKRKNWNQKLNYHKKLDLDN